MPEDLEVNRVPRSKGHYYVGCSRLHEAFFHMNSEWIRSCWCHDSFIDYFQHFEHLISILTDFEISLFRELGGLGTALEML